MGFAFVAAMAVSSFTFGHGGGLDGQGCHNDSSAGDYHCHQGEHAGEHFSSKSQMLNSADSGANSSSGSASGSFSRSRSDSSPSETYDRDDYHPGWEDHDGDCQDVRDEVLIAESEIPVEFETSRECEVISGKWRGRYSGKVFTDPGKLHIDHLVPLKEVHESGASEWSIRRRRAYANDLKNPDTLIAVAAGENLSKGADGPSEWMPSNDEFHCEYIERWVGVKEAWGLEMDREETKAVESRLKSCG